ncbi:hypothetical protein LguiA_015053 [Lonicera macranthoides]
MVAKSAKNMLYIFDQVNPCSSEETVRYGPYQLHCKFISLLLSGGGLLSYSETNLNTNVNIVNLVEDVNKKKRLVIVGAKNVDIHYWEAECVKSDAANKKEVEDAQRIRRTGPTGVEFAVELHDFVVEDLVKLYPMVKDFVKMTLLEAGDHILNMFDERITAFAYGFIGGRANRRVLATDEWLRVEGCDCVYALGDCATINQCKVMEDNSEIFNKADKDKSGTLTVKEFQEALDDICERYPQVQIYLKNKRMLSLVDLLKDYIGDASKESIELNIEEFKLVVCQVDSQMKHLPATGQVQSPLDFVRIPILLLNLNS